MNTLYCDYAYDLGISRPIKTLNFPPKQGEIKGDGNDIFKEYVWCNNTALNTRHHNGCI